MGAARSVASMLTGRRLWGAGMVVAGLMAERGWASAQIVEISNLLSGTGGFVTVGSSANDQAGRSVSGCGDVNGDGIDDFIVGAPLGDVPFPDCGRAYVVFGRSGGSPAYQSAIANGTGGFVINGAAPSDQAGTIVRGAGDINGDGLNDLLVGAPLSDPATGLEAGRAYVIFGRQSTTAVNLSALGADGIELIGPAAGARAGTSLDHAGDVNGDGYGDFVVGANFPGEFSSTNDKFFVVFGGTSLPTSFNLSAVGGTVAGFTIEESVHAERLGEVVSGAGDFNGDGLSDILVGSPNRNAFGAMPGGGVSVVFGKTSQTPVIMSNILAGVGGQSFSGAVSGHDVGRAVASAGDVNGDGLVDIVFGAPLANNYAGDLQAGRVYVAFGRTTTGAAENILLTLVNGTGGFVIEGFHFTPPETGHQCGAAVSGAGDVNGDGLADVILGSPKTDVGVNVEVGRAYVVFGKATGSAVLLNTVATGVGGIAIKGQFAGDEVGTAVSGVGDANGDGMSDVVVGVPFRDAVSAADAGQVAVIHSPIAPPVAPANYRVRIAPGNAPRTAVGAGAWGPHGNTFNPARVSLDFAQGTGPGGGASQVQVTLVRSDANIANLGTPEQIANWQLGVSNVDRTSAGTPVWTFRYTDAEIAGLNESSLKLYRSTTGNTGPWVLMPATLNVARNEFAANLGNFGQFAIADLDAPTVTITTLDGNPFAGQLPRYAVSFSEPVGNTFTVDDVLIGTTSGFAAFPVALSVTGNDPNYIVQLMVFGPVTPGSGLLFFLGAGSVTDKAGNPVGFAQAPWYTLYPPPAAVGPGDINKDGNVDVADVTALANHIVNGTPLP